MTEKLQKLVFSDKLIVLPGIISLGDGYLLYNLTTHVINLSPYQLGTFVSHSFS